MATETKEWVDEVEERLAFLENERDAAQTLITALKTDLEAKTLILAAMYDFFEGKGFLLTKKVHQTGLEEYKMSLHDHERAFAAQEKMRRWIYPREEEKAP